MNTHGTSSLLCLIYAPISHKPLDRAPAPPAPRSCRERRANWRIRKLTSGRGSAPRACGWADRGAHACPRTLIHIDKHLATPAGRKYTKKTPPTQKKNKESGSQASTNHNYPRDDVQAVARNGVPLRRVPCSHHDEAVEPMAGPNRPHTSLYTDPRPEDNFGVVMPKLKSRTPPAHRNARLRSAPARLRCVFGVGVRRRSREPEGRHLRRLRTSSPAFGLFHFSRSEGNARRG